MAVEIDDTFTPEQKQLLLKDFDLLKKINVDRNSSEIKRLFVKGENARMDFYSWMSERTKFILSQSFEVNSDNLIMVTAEGVFADSFKPSMNPALNLFQAMQNSHNAPKKQISMKNLGVAIYAEGKKNRKLYQLILDQEQKVLIDSPRVGILQAGEIFFAGIRSGLDSEAMANSLKRLSTLIHESRHSDGRNSSLGFPHALCPEGHNFAGYFACDVASNGAYAVAAAFLKDSTSQCEDCSAEDKEALRVVYMDSYSRLLSSQGPASPQEEQSVQEACLELARINPSFASDLGADVCKNSKESVDTAKEVYLDETPEYGGLQ